MSNHQHQQLAFKRDSSEEHVAALQDSSWSTGLTTPKFVKRTDWGSYQELTLQNGMTLHLAHIPQSLDCHLGLLVEVGARDEKLHEKGMSHFIEHLHFRGTHQYPSSDKLTSTARRFRLDLNGYTNSSVTVYTMRGPNASVVPAVTLMEDMIRNSTFKSKDIELEKNVVSSELAEFNINFDRRILELYLLPTLYPDLSLEIPTLGTFENVRSFNRDSLIAFKQKHYVPSNMHLFISGNLPERIEDEVQKTLGSIPNIGTQEGTQTKPYTKFTSPKPLEQLMVEKFPMEAIVALISFPGVPFDSVARNSVDAIVSFFNERKHGDFHRRMRTDSGLVYSHPNYHYVDKGFSSVQFRFVIPSESELNKVLRTLRQSLKLLQKRGLSPDDLSAAKANVLTMVPKYDANVHSSLLASFALCGRVILSDEYRNGINSVTNETIIKTAKEIFSTPMHVAAFGKVEKHKIVIP